jgi:hypothetical protein
MVVIILLAPATPAKPSLSPIIAHSGLFRHDRFESYMFSQKDFPEQAVLPQLDRLQSHHFKQRQKHTNQRLP